MFERLKAAAQFLAEKFENFFEWMTDRWYRVVIYFGAATVLNIVGLIATYSWYFLATTIVSVGYGIWLTRVAWLNEQDMKARVEEALAEVDFNDTSRWITRERPQR